MINHMDGWMDGETRLGSGDCYHSPLTLSESDGRIVCDLNIIPSIAPVIIRFICVYRAGLYEVDR